MKLYYGELQVHRNVHTVMLASLFIFVYTLIITSLSYGGMVS